MNTVQGSYSSMPGFLPGAAYQASIPPTSGSQPRLAYFITRSNGLLVPLIPADELPFNLKLANVPRVLTPPETCGLHYVGNAPFNGGTFKLERELATSMLRSSSQPPNESGHGRTQSGTGMKQFLAPDAVARQPYKYSTTASTPKRLVSAAELSKSWRRSDPVAGPSTESSDPAQSVIDAILNSASGAETAERLGYRRNDTTPPPSGRLPDQEKKEYCTYWILHGDCAYVQQGCRYKHEMPEKAKLSEIGINHVPRWWQEKNMAIKLGGEKAIVGERMKPSEWLKRKDSTSSDESETESEGTDYEDEKPAVVVVVPKKEEKEEKVGSKEILASPSPPPVAAGSKSPVMPPTRPSSPANDEVRKQSASPSTSDLIDFAPLLPSSVPAKVTMTITPRSHPSKTPKNSNPMTTKVFVPAGESPKSHIADVRKRERAARAAKQSRTPSPSNVNANKSTAQSLSLTTKGSGLLASKHAPPAAEAASDCSPKPHLKANCRPRRPASSSPAKILEGSGSEGEKKEK